MQFSTLLPLLLALAPAIPLTSASSSSSSETHQAGPFPSFPPGSRPSLLHAALLERHRLTHPPDTPSSYDGPKFWNPIGAHPCVKECIPEYYDLQYLQDLEVRSKILQCLERECPRSQKESEVQEDGIEAGGEKTEL
ncbi:hypothetical protein BJ508DRAFT_314929 [Ascobolus immersus RN42]|uniref:Uncharacterized protein n=1 Tax=Ascobolus immersus RN42 TaxID=1160509 RepID=A0A3N4HD67_ASCIM|nr:hypothetical protein BJ508DRAFT_314929 [Ascobolus immersus RN42]